MAYLTLEDGSVFEGAAFGAKKDVFGEVVFNTGMTGYQEILTDPSYCGQIVTMTYPLIGNYGVNSFDVESTHPQVTAFIVRELCKTPSNWRCEGTLEDYLIQNGIPGMEGVDTRALTKIIREHGTMRAMITQELPTKEMIDKMMKFETRLPVDTVTCKQPYQMGDGAKKIAVLDFGAKQNILRCLCKRDVTLTVFPARTSAKTILLGGFDGLLLTNGPGDPKENAEVIENVQKLFGKLPTMGICLGHQLLALAHGSDTEKLRYGHRGCNHPVKDVEKDRVYITSQNHGYTIVKKSLKDDMVLTHVNLNDDTIEGVKYRNAPVFSVQFHPEAAPGPEDSAYLFDEFFDMLKEKK